ncbi:hypothetical protein LV779_02115 [Streptomyces thinghirensis]|nr:hypothetical protein [Streptomyces thinghirensis]
MRTLAAQRAVIVVAHRISTVQDADLIVVVDEGRIVDRGTHEELLTRSTLYQELVHATVAARPGAARGRHRPGRPRRHSVRRAGRVRTGGRGGGPATGVEPVGARRLLVIGTGSVTAAHLPFWASWLKAGHPGTEVRYVLTGAATRFVTRRRWTAIGGCDVLTDRWPDEPEPRARHVDLAQWPDAVVVLPATLNYLARLATGLGDSPSVLRAPVHAGRDRRWHPRCHPVARRAWRTRNTPPDSARAGTWSSYHRIPAAVRPVGSARRGRPRPSPKCWPRPTACGRNWRRADLGGRPGPDQEHAPA